MELFWLTVVRLPLSGVNLYTDFWRNLMKKILALALVTCTLAPAFAQTNVGVSIGISQPGVYGRIDIGNVAPPPVVYPQPVVIAPSPVAMHQRPIYLYVPPSHQQNWAQHCHRYSACGQPVYFVHENWVRERYEERRGQERGNRGYEGRENREHGRERDGERRGEGERRNGGRGER
jgi:hypothetical protein